MNVLRVKGGPVSAVIVAITVVCAAVLVAWLFLTPKHPENGASHADEQPPETLAQRLYGRNPPGPAGPDAESQNPDDIGNAWSHPPVHSGLTSDQAPDFSLPAGPDSMVHLADLRGRPVVLVFYPADWSPVCSDQLALYQAIVHEFDAYDAALIAISVDGVWCHRAFAGERGLTFPLLADFEPKGEVSRRYGVYREDDGFSERALFVLSADGTVHWSEIVPPEVNPGADGILDALDRLAGRRVVASSSSERESNSG
jgi:peroxiredoxin